MKTTGSGQCAENQNLSNYNNYYSYIVTLYTLVKNVSGEFRTHRKNMPEYTHGMFLYSQLTLSWHLEDSALVAIHQGNRRNIWNFLKGRNKFHIFAVHTQLIDDFREGIVSHKRRHCKLNTAGLKNMIGLFLS